MASSQGIRAGKAFVEIGADLKALREGLSKATINVGSFAAGVGKTVAKAAKVASFALAGIGAGLAGATAAFLATDKRLLTPEESDAADRLRESVTGLAQSAQQAAAGLMSTLQPAISVVIDIVRNGLAAFREWITTQADLVAGITSFLGGIRDALSAGDIAAAANILWQGIKVAWRAGIMAVMDATLEWKTSIQQTMSEAFMGLVKMATDAWSGIRDAATLAADVIVNVYEKAVAKVTKALAVLGEKVGIFDEGTAAMAGEDNDRRAKARTEERARRDAAIAKDLRKAEEEFGETVAEANRMIADSNRNALKAAQDDLSRAKSDLDSLVGDAAAKAADVGRKLPDVVKFGDVKTSVLGTFSGAAASAMDASVAPMKKVEEHTKKTADATKQMADTLADIRDSGGLVYA